MAELALWLAFFVLVLVASVLALRYLAPIFGLEPVPLVRASLAVLLAAGQAALFLVLGWWLGPRLAAPWYVSAAVVAVIVLVLGIGIARLVLGLNVRSTLRAGLLLIVTGGVVVALGAIPLKFCYPAYVLPTNAMAPTLKGRHFTGKCLHCGGETVVSFVEDQSPFSPPQRLAGELGICGQCLQVAPATAVNETARIGDRILVRSLATAHRWDLVVFLYPGERRQIYVSRLVALPGESIEVKDGGLWINGTRQTPPPEIASLKWFLETDRSDLGRYANAGSPTRLGSNEYFVLGDFSPISSDSRFWGPVPKDHLLGVVGVVYFPPRSWKVLPKH